MLQFFSVWQYCAVLGFCNPHGQEFVSWVFKLIGVLIGKNRMTKALFCSFVSLCFVAPVAVVIALLSSFIFQEYLNVADFRMPVFLLNYVH